MLKPFLLFSLTAALPMAANAAPCASTEHVTTALSAQFSETIQIGGILSNGNLVVVHSDPNRRSWTVLVALPDRQISCLVATGHGDKALEAQLSGLRTS